MRTPAPAPGPDTLCECDHWFEEHEDEGRGPCYACSVSANDDPEFEPCRAYAFCSEYNTISEVADRGGYPESWPAWMKAQIGPATMASILAAKPAEQARLVREAASRSR